MNFNLFSNRVKAMFVISSILVFLALGLFITFLVEINDKLNILYLVLFLWSSTASTLIFHYLLWQNLSFLNKINLGKANAYTIILSLIVYIALFPIISFLTFVFLIIFDVAIFILFLVNLFSKNKKLHIPVDNQEFEEKPEY